MKKIFFWLSNFSWVILPSIALAAGDLGLSNAGKVELNQGDLVSMIAKIVNTALVLVGVLALAFFIYGGFLYITAAGDTEQIEKAKKILIYAVIGIVVIGLAYSVVQFVINAFTGSGSSSGSSGSGSSGNGSVYNPS